MSEKKVLNRDCCTLPISLRGYALLVSLMLLYDLIMRFNFLGASFFQTLISLLKPKHPVLLLFLKTCTFLTQKCQIVSKLTTIFASLIKLKYSFAHIAIGVLWVSTQLLRSFLSAILLIKLVQGVLKRSTLAIIFPSLCPSSFDEPLYSLIVRSQVT